MGGKVRKRLEVITIEYPALPKRRLLTLSQDLLTVIHVSSNYQKMGPWGNLIPS
jgi:hypothetical protein